MRVCVRVGLLYTASLPALLRCRGTGLACLAPCLPCLIWAQFQLFVCFHCRRFFQGVFTASAPAPAYRHSPLRPTCACACVCVWVAVLMWAQFQLLRFFGSMVRAQSCYLAPVWVRACGSALPIVIALGVSSIRRACASVWSCALPCAGAVLSLRPCRSDADPAFSIRFLPPCAGIFQLFLSLQSLVFTGFIGILGTVPENFFKKRT